MPRRDRSTSLVLEGEGFVCPASSATGAQEGLESRPSPFRLDEMMEDLGTHLHSLFWDYANRHPVIKRLAMAGISISPY